MVDIVTSVIHQYNIKTMLDIPCGDFNWMKTIDLSGISYQGADIVDDLIAQNKKRYEQPHIIFYKADLLTSPLPQVDLIVCRDCLVHFSNKHIKMAIANFKRSKSTYLLITTFPDNKNYDIVTGSWRKLNLCADPFSFPEPLMLKNEDNETSLEKVFKHLSLWRIKDLP